ncbi:baseplate J/gp47 family protein [Magnetococcus sp. PR-3]|uniref:baseplate J/gp47 family protein n=1 Tax=Magnetococcus sp. PR-3 TaxID=3120355 RepID=UPI002FCE64B5
MPFDRPPLQQIIGRNLADAKGKLTGVHLDRASATGVILRALSGASHELHGHIDHTAKQIIPASASSEELERIHANPRGIFRKSGVRAGGTVQLTGVTGAVLPAGSTLTRADGRSYVTQADATLADGMATVAVLDAAFGVAGDSDAGTVLTLANGPVGIDPGGVVDESGLAGGVDAESNADLLARVQYRMRHPIRGGHEDDYWQWVTGHGDVTRCWVVRREFGGGTVGIRFMTDDLTEDGIPSDEMVETIQTLIDATRPVGADPYVIKPTGQALDLTLSITPDSDALRSQVQAEIRALLRRLGAPGVMLTMQSIDRAIFAVSGVASHTMTLPASDVAHGDGVLPIMGEITWL